MESKAAVLGLSALAHEGRLAAFRMLVRAGEQGMAAGDIARRLGVPANTLSANLNLLGQAGLVDSRRNGRSIIYNARYERMAALLEFLVEDCCGGRADICSPLAGAIERSHCRPAGAA